MPETDPTTGQRPARRGVPFFWPMTMAAALAEQGLTLVDAPDAAAIARWLVDQGAPDNRARTSTAGL